jgi:hypothetical protein
VNDSLRTGLSNPCVSAELVGSLLKTTIEYLVLGRCPSAVQEAEAFPTGYPCPFGRIFHKVRVDFPKVRDYFLFNG